MRARRHLSDRPAIVCVVRHPLAWYESWFRYQTARGWTVWAEPGSTRRWHPLSEQNGTADSDFKGFMQKVNAQAPGFVTTLYARYAEAAGATVLRNETLAADLAGFLSARGLIDEAGPIHAEILAAPRLNVSPPAPVAWDPGLRAETLANEATALRRYGYEADAAPS